MALNPEQHAAAAAERLKLLIGEKFDSVDSREVSLALHAVEDAELERMEQDGIFEYDIEFRKQCAMAHTLGVAEATIAAKNRQIEWLLNEQFKNDKEFNELHPDD